MITVEQVLYIIPVLALTASITYYALNIRNQNRTRQAQLLMQIVNQFCHPNIVEARDLFNRIELNSVEDLKNIFEDREKAVILRRYWGWVEGIGVVVRENYLDVKVIAGVMFGVVTRDWEKLAPYVGEYRELIGSPRAWIEWEYLYDKLMEYARENPEFS